MERWKNGVQEPRLEVEEHRSLKQSFNMRNARGSWAVTRVDLSQSFKEEPDSGNHLWDRIFEILGSSWFVKNQFSGRIPSSLSHIDGLSFLDLSFNLLSGEIPEGTQLQSFNASSYEGNLDLCEKPLEKICQEGEQRTPAHFEPQEDHETNSEFFEAFYMSMGIGFAVGLWVFLGPILLNRSWRSTYLRFLNNLVDREYLADRWMRLSFRNHNDILLRWINFSNI